LSHKLDVQKIEDDHDDNVILEEIDVNNLHVMDADRDHADHAT